MVHFENQHQLFGKSLVAKKRAYKGDNSFSNSKQREQVNCFGRLFLFEFDIWQREMKDYCKGEGLFCKQEGVRKNEYTLKT